MPNPVQWTADRALAELNSAKAKFQAEWTAMGHNNVAVQHLVDRANQLTEPRARAAAIASANLWAARQVRLQNDFIRAYGKWHDAYNALAAFFRTVGLKAPPDTGLAGAGLGVVPAAILVPAIVAGVVITAITWAAWMHDQNVTQRDGLAIQNKALDALINGQMSSADYQVATQRANDSARPKPPPGIGDLAGMLIPALGLVALIVLGPSIMRVIPSRSRVEA
jgi:hypothetical protein